MLTLSQYTETDTYCSQKGKIIFLGPYNGWEADDKVNLGISASLQKVIEIIN